MSWNLPIERRDRAVTWRGSALAVALMVTAAVALFWLFQRQIAGPSPAFYLPPEILPALEESMEDQKRLGDLDPRAEAAIGGGFDELENHRRSAAHPRAQPRASGQRYELVLLGLLAASVALATAISRSATLATRLVSPGCRRPCRIWRRARVRSISATAGATRRPDRAHDRGDVGRDRARSPAAAVAAQPVALAGGGASATPTRCARR